MDDNKKTKPSLPGAYCCTSLGRTTLSIPTISMTEIKSSIVYGETDTYLPVNHINILEQDTIDDILEKIDKK